MRVQVGQHLEILSGYGGERGRAAQRRSAHRPIVPPPRLIEGLSKAMPWFSLTAHNPHDLDIHRARDERVAGQEP